MKIGSRSSWPTASVHCPCLELDPRARQVDHVWQGGTRPSTCSANLPRRTPGATSGKRNKTASLLRLRVGWFESSASQNSTKNWWSLGDYPVYVGLYGGKLMDGRESPRCWDNVPAHAES